jgi:outer membrane protein TolC
LSPVPTKQPALTAAGETTDPNTDARKWNSVINEFAPAWQFLNQIKEDLVLLPIIRTRIVGFVALLLIIGGCSVSPPWSDRMVAKSPDSPPAPPEASADSLYRLVAAELPTRGAEESSGEVPSVDTLRRGPSGSQPRDGNWEPNRFREITEAELLALAFANAPVLRPLGVRILENPSSVATIYDRAITASDPFFGPQAALAEFDSRLTASANAQNNDRVFNNATVGGGIQQLTQDLVNLNAGWERRSRSGAIWDLRRQTIYDDNNRSGNSFPNYWETIMEAGVRQPLLQGAGKEFNTIAGPNARPGFNFSNGILIAQLNTRISDADFEIAVRTFVRDLYVAYWDLVREYHNYQSLLAARELSYRTWQSVLAKSKAKLSGGEANKEAQARAKYYRYCREVQLALGGDGRRGGLYVTERQLRLMLGLPAVEAELLRPAEQPTDVRVVFDYDQMVSRAMVQRTELQRQAVKVRQQSLRLVAAKNFLLPQLDFIGRYRLRGFGDDLTGGGPRFSSAFQDYYSFDHQEMELGFEMGLAVGRRQARAAVRNATWQLKREQAVLAQQQRSVENQVSDAIAEVSTSFYTMQSSAAQLQAARERLESSESLFQADKLQIEFLLDAQEELARVQLQHAADQSRYALSLVNIHNVTGQLLAESGVYISGAGCQVGVISPPSSPAEFPPAVATAAKSPQRLPALQ